jgi:hypothetical protein
MFALVLAAAIAFDTEMTQEEKDKTGVARLSLEERSALQEWIEEHHSKKILAQGKKSGPIIQEVLKNGRYVRLSDNSLWEIDPADTPITQSWITAVEIKVSSRGSGDYPYTLNNTLTGSSVKARKATSITDTPKK